MSNRLQFFAFCLLLSAFCFTLSAQTISNVQLVYSCPCKITINYNLHVTKATDVQFYFSPDTLGIGVPCVSVGNWQLAETFPARMPGANTDIWDCEAAGVLYGQIFFKLLPVQETECVWINGICWATRNVDMPGNFAANPEDAGMFYQWNRNIGWSITDPMINSNGGTTWDSSIPPGTEWESANDPSPPGYRVPSGEEIQTLLNTTYVTQVWTTENGKTGRRFTDIATGSSIFLPAAGFRFSHGALNLDGTYYWSSTQYNASIAYGLNFNSSGANQSINSKNYGFSVRPVLE